MPCLGDSTTVPKQFSDLVGTMSTAQLPTGTAVQASAVNLTAQGANIGATPVFAVATTGFYRVTSKICRTQIASGGTPSSTLPSLTIAWTDGDNSAAGSTAVSATNATNTLAIVTPVQIIVYAKTGTNITYATASYATAGTTPMQYAVHIKCEAL